ncbi:GNAT family N-acetyltransferase [Emticicia sp. BO119]|uniref:GNAT family N-acetyltransferase n=1 Tax=Emticicia sp. BO119 TaxID=2757768 RepID=UPI0015F06381|nr:GNAT family N-acetyltransferase [Emticicia sp. BO119]MBA4851921.1 GNAT family N-acetyltransferase [Emticicia sp. BO119]
MLIRLATPADAPRLRELSEITFRDTYTTYNTPENMDRHVAKNFTLQQIETELHDSANQYVVCENEGELIAFVKLVKNHSTKGLTEKKVVEIERIYVLKAFHGQQSGRKLIDFCTDWAKEQGFEIIWLGVWEHNPNAIKFYEKMGYVRFGEHTFTLGDDVQTDFVMKKYIR